MAAFLHVAPMGTRFNGPELGSWYASAEIPTAVAEVGHHLRREAIATGLPELSRTYRGYVSRLAGEYADIRGRAADMPDVYATDSYAASQAYGERVRASGGAGILYDSIRRRGGVNAVAYRPTNVLDVVQADHFEVRVVADRRRIDVRKLAIAPRS